MRKLIIALAVIAQPALADYYVVAVPSDRMTEMVAYEGVPRPVDAYGDDDKHDWLVVKDNDEHVKEYLDNATDIIPMSASALQHFKKTCGVVARTCVQTILAESGHD